MNKIVKLVISIMMSVAMAVSIVPSGVGAEEMSDISKDDILSSRVSIGKIYTKNDKYGKITAQFTNQSNLLVTYTDLTNTSRYINMYVTTFSKDFGVRNFVVKANKAHSESYSLNIQSATKVTITVYRHTSTNPKSAQIDPLMGIMPD